MRLYLVRHPAVAVDPGVCYGASDLPLHPGWESSLLALRAALPAGLPVHSSPLRRCHDLAIALSPTARTDTRLRELDFGRWEMQAWDKISRDELDAWAAAPLTYAGYGGESVAMMQLRVTEALGELTADCLWVTHAGVMKLVCAQLLGLPEPQWLGMSFAHASVVCLEQDNTTSAGWRLLP